MIVVLSVNNFYGIGVLLWLLGPGRVFKGGRSGIREKHNNCVLLFSHIRKFESSAYSRTNLTLFYSLSYEPCNVICMQILLFA